MRIRSTAILALALLLPLGARAEPPRVTSDHVPKAQVKNDKQKYVALNPKDDPLTFSAVGPSKVDLVLRQVWSKKNKPGKTVTNVIVLRDGARFEHILLMEKGNDRARRGKTRYSSQHRMTIKVAPGSHEFTVRVTSRDHHVLAGITAAGDEGSADDDVPLAGLGPAPSGGAGADDVPLAGLGPAPTGGAAADDVPLAGLGPAPTGDAGGDDVPLAGLGPAPTGGASADDDVPLVGLGGPPADAGDDDVPLVGLGGPPPSDDDAGGVPLPPLVSGDDVTISSITAEDGGVDSAGGFVAPPLMGDEIPDEPATPLEPGFAVLGVRGLLSQTGFGTGTLGGGVDVMIRPGLLDNQLAVGVSVDMLPQRLRADVALATGSALRVEVGFRALPILAGALYTFNGTGPLRWQASAGIGPSLLSVSSGGGSRGSVGLGVAAGFGALFRLGPGRLTATARLSGNYGGVGAPKDAVDQVPLMSAGWLGGLGLLVGYQLEL